MWKNERVNVIGFDLLKSFIRLNRALSLHSHCKNLAKIVICLLSKVKIFNKLRNNDVNENS